MDANDLRRQMPGLEKKYELTQLMIAEIQDYAIIFLDIDGVVRDWNAGAEKIKLYAHEEIVGKHFSVFYFEEDQKNNLPSTLLQIAETEGRAHHEGWRRRRDGTRFWGGITITALHNEDSVVGFVKVTRDLTEKKLAEDRLRTSEERYHRMIAEVQDYAIIFLDVDGVVQNWNAGAEKIKGYTAGEIIGKRFEVFYTREDRASNLPDTLLNRAKHEGRAVQEGWRVRKNGTRFWGSITITALHDDHGAIIGYSKVTRDLTEKKVAEDKMREYTNELEIRNKELEQFAYVASHDLQEPLRKIRTFTGLIGESMDDKATMERYLGKLSLSAHRMSQLIGSLLNYSRLAKDTFLMEKVDMNEVVDTVKYDMELLIAEKDAAIIIDTLPHVHGYKLQMEQLFSNLISNALKFTNTIPVIRISCCKVHRKELDIPDYLVHDRYYHFTVEDNGIGFDRQYAERIFSLFQRLHEKHEYEGTGIGLSLCRKIVENHRGHIYGEGNPGEGAKFHIYLPEVQDSEYMPG